MGKLLSLQKKNKFCEIFMHTHEVKLENLNFYWKSEKTSPGRYIEVSVLDRN